MPRREALPGPRLGWGNPADSWGRPTGTAPPKAGNRAPVAARSCRPRFRTSPGCGRPLDENRRAKRTAWARPILAVEATGATGAGRRRYGVAPWCGQAQARIWGGAVPADLTGPRFLGQRHRGGLARRKPCLGGSLKLRMASGPFPAGSVGPSGTAAPGREGLERSQALERRLA